MRVLTFLHSFDPGGVERVALRLNQAWQAAGHDVAVVMGRDDGVLRSQADGLAYRTLAPKWLPTARWETLWMILTLPRLVRALRPDVLFCAGNTYTVVAVALKLILGHRCPPIAAKVSNDFDRTDFAPIVRRAYRLWLRLQARYIDMYVGIAEPMRAQIERLTGVAQAFVEVVNDPAVELAKLARGDRPDRDPDRGRRFLGVGRLSPQKNFALALTAFARIARPDDRLTLLGEGPQRAMLAALATTLGIADQVMMPGFVTDVPGHFAQSDVFVLSSDFEGVPAVVVDALAAGIAIVATDCCISMNDLVADGALGTLVPVGDLAALAAAMDSALDRVPDSAAMRARAIHFTIEAAAPRWWHLFARLADQRAAASATPANRAWHAARAVKAEQ